MAAIQLQEQELKNQNLLFSSRSPSSSIPLRGGAISFLEHKSLRFIINDSPSDKNLPDYIREFKHYNVKHLVRLCEPSYSDLPLSNEGIKVHDLRYEDGGVPPDSVVHSWLALVESTFGSSKSCTDLKGKNEDKIQQSADQQHPAIAVHCVAGLGRAPVLVAIALIEYGMPKLDAIEFIRRKRRGAFNSRQIQYVDSYKKQSSRAFKSTFDRLFRRSK